MIRPGSLPLTVIASPVGRACRIGQAEDSPSSLLRLLLALCSKLDGAFHQGTVFVFPLFGKLLLLFLSGCSSLADGRLCSGANSPDGTPSSSRATCSNDLALWLSGRTQLHIPLMQAVLRFPRNFLGLFRNALLSSAQPIPDTWWTAIAPCCFANDSSQVCVASLSDASASDSLATGVFAWHRAAIPHQLPSTAEAGYLAQLGGNGHS